MLWSLCREVQSQAKGLFDDNIPHGYIKLLSAGRRWLYGAGLYAVAGSIIAVLFWYTFTQTLATETLATTRTTSNCMPVDRPTTGSFLADFSGNWANTQSFDPSRAVYQLALNNFTTDATASASASASATATTTTTTTTLPEFYASKMEWIGSVLGGTVWELFTTNDLAHNLLYLYFWRLQFYTHSNIQEFSFTATPASTFGQEYNHLTGTGDAAGACGVVPRTEWLESSFLIEWDSAAYWADADCVRSLPPGKLGVAKGGQTPSSNSSGGSGGGSIRVELDSRTLLAAVAANYPRPPKESLQQHSLYAYGSNSSLSLRLIWGSDFDFPYAPQTPTINVGQYYDERYPGMDALYCIRRYNSDDGVLGAKFTCLVKVGLVFGLPIWNHFGESLEEPVPCKCPAPGANCQSIDILSGLVLFVSDDKGTPFDSMTQVIAALLAVDELPNVAGDSLSTRAFNASWYTPPRLVRQGGSPYDSLLVPPLPQTPSSRRRAFDFCSTPLGSCTLLVTRSVNPLPKVSLNKISPTYLILSNGACSAGNIFSPSSWARLTAVPPSPLTEAYYKCFPDAPTAAFVATGASLANGRALIPIVALLLVNLLWLWQLLTGRSPPRLFSRQEKDQVLDALASRVLLCRYSKLRDLALVEGDGDGGGGGDGDEDGAGGAGGAGKEQGVDRIPRSNKGKAPPSSLLQFSPLVQSITAEVEASLGDFTVNGIVHAPSALPLNNNNNDINDDDDNNNNNNNNNNITTNSKANAAATTASTEIYICRLDDDGAPLRACRGCGGAPDNRSDVELSPMHGGKSNAVV